jgi:hypothetical protein
MARIAYLRDQLARAERLAKAILDRQTAEQLQAFAAECREAVAQGCGVRLLGYTSFIGVSATTRRSMRLIS